MFTSVDLRLHMLLLFGCIILLPMPAANAQGLTRQQLESLVPSDQDFHGFVRAQPSAALSDLASTDRAKTYTNQLDSDEVELDKDVTQWSIWWVTMPSEKGKYSLIQRSLFSEDDKYTLNMVVIVCDSENTAHKELLARVQQCQIPYIQGAYSGIAQIGNESWINQDATVHSLLCRSGNTLIFIQGQLSFDAQKYGYIAAFPSPANDAVAYQILLRASQQPELTGVSAEQATLAVNGHALPKGALRVAGQTYVPVKAFAQAMGLTAGWNVKTGALTLTGPNGKTFALTAGSTAATLGGAKTAALSVPVLKQAGEPVMTLDDLLRMTGGRITARSESAVHVKG